MKFLSILLIGTFLLVSCVDRNEISSINPENWEKRITDIPLEDTLLKGSSYLSVYSQIYGMTEHRTHDLTVTISMRNTNLRDTVYINKASYYNTEGKLIRTYFDRSVFLLPMETVEIIIDETDREGGTGANFVFDWAILPGSNEPYFEAVMISTANQQGLSFSTKGIKIK
ncbi:MAG: DUF3124 domain-containing protein [Bacteroidetes bacterium]|nr:DUF3124 domain-containing protein [Bacteroidota bacterium]